MFFSWTNEFTVVDVLDEGEVHFFWIQILAHIRLNLYTY